MRGDPAIQLCGFDFNETQFGWDTCDKPVGHGGSHYDSVSGHYG